MLILGRKVDEKLIIQMPDGQLITILVVEINKDKIRLGIDAPRNIAVDREEIYISKQEQQRALSGGQDQ